VNLGTFFESIYWNQLWEKSFSTKFKSIAFEPQNSAPLNSNEKLYGSLEKKAQGLLKVLHLAPGGCYIHAHHKQNPHLQNIFSQHQDSIITYVDYNLDTKVEPSLYCTQVIQNKNYTPHSSHIRHVKKAQSLGLKATKKNLTEENIKTYFQLYQNTLLRFHAEDRSINRIYPLEFFLNMLHIPHGIVNLWVCEKEDQWLSASLWFDWNGVLTYWHGVSLAEHLHLRPNDLKFWTIIQDGLSAQKIIDLMPSGGMGGTANSNLGVVQFKKKCGAQFLAYEMVQSHGFIRKGIVLCRKILKKI
jgi:hypothetical protein